MSWVWFDDKFYTHPKVLDLSEDTRLEAVALHFLAICWSNDHLTDGKISLQQAKNLSGLGCERLKEVVDDLLSVGLWEPHPKQPVPNIYAGDIYLIHDYLDYQQSREEAEAKRAEVSRKRSIAGKKGMESRWGMNSKDNKTITNTLQTDNPTPTPTPTISKKSTSSLGSEDQLLEEFEEFWKLYPRKRPSKKAAYIKYRAARKVADFDTIMAGLTAQLPGWSSKEEQFIPHATTWLNQERWTAGVEAEDSVDPELAMAFHENKNLRRMR